MEKTFTKVGTKAYQRKDREDRSLGFRTWYRELDSDIQASIDLDMLPNIYIDGEVVPTAVYELTAFDGDRETVNEKYLDAIIKRYRFRDGQAKIIRAHAKNLGVDAFIILHHKDKERIKNIYVYNLSKFRGWSILDTEGFIEFENALAKQARENRGLV